MGVEKPSTSTFTLPNLNLGPWYGGALQDIFVLDGPEISRNDMKGPADSDGSER